MSASDEEDGEEAARGWTDEASYVCGSCGEEIVVPLDPSAGERQSYVEDCPVCCHPQVIHVFVDDDGIVSIDAQAEQDY